MLQLIAVSTAVALSPERSNSLILSTSCGLVVFFETKVSNSSLQYFYNHLLQTIVAMAKDRRAMVDNYTQENLSIKQFYAIQINYIH